MKMKENMRDFLSKKESLNYILHKIKSKGFRGDSTFAKEIQSAVLERLLEREDYYTREFESSIKCFISLIIVEVLGKIQRKSDALNGDLFFLDAVATNCEEGEQLLGHDIVSSDMVVTEPEKIYTREGIPETLTYYLSQLPEQQSDVFALKAVYGHSHEEIADLLGIGVDYSRKLYMEAKRELSVFIDNEKVFMVKQSIGNTSGRIISNDAGDANIWADWSWKECNAEPGPVFYPLQEAALN